MTYTDEPRGLQWVNNLNTDTFGSLVTNACWLAGSLTLTLADYQLLTSGNELARQAGLFLAGILVAAWGGKTVAGVVSSQQKRTANPAYAAVLEAEERGKATAAARAAAAALIAANGQATHAALQPPNGAAPAPAVTITARDQSTVTVDAEPGDSPAPPAPRPTGDARVDDERGEP